MKPSEFANLSRKEKAFIIAAINIKIKEDEKIKSKLKSK